MGYIDFTFNGTSARDMRIKSVRVEEGNMHFPFATSSNLQTVRLPDSVETYLYKSHRENLEINLQLMLVDDNDNPKIWTETDIYNVADWLIQDGYKPLVLGGKTGVMYYAHLQNADSLSHYGNGGILPITFATNSPYGWSIPSIETYTVAGTSNIELLNKSNVLSYYRPTIEIKSTKANGDIKIQNVTLNDAEIVLSDLYLDEVVSIDNERELIYTDKPLALMSGRFNYTFLKLRRGSNTIKVTGDCVITIRHQYPIIS